MTNLILKEENVNCLTHRELWCNAGSNHLIWSTSSMDSFMFGQLYHMDKLAQDGAFDLEKGVVEHS